MLDDYTSGWRYLPSVEHRKPEVDVLITPEARAKQTALVQLCNHEVAWFGVVDTVETSTGRQYDRVVDIIVPKQEVGSAHVDQEGFDLNSLLEEHADVAHMIRYHGHSHVWMGAYHSDIDVRAIVEWEHYGMSYMISYVENKEGDYACRLDQFEPRRVASRVRMLDAKAITQDVVHWATQQLQEKVSVWIPQSRKSKRDSMHEGMDDSWYEHGHHEPYKPKKDRYSSIWEEAFNAKPGEVVERHAD